MKKLQLIIFGVALMSFASVSAQKVEGKVFNLKTNEPIKGSEITFMDVEENKLLSLYSNAKGIYSFDADELENVHKIVTSAKNYNTAEVLISEIKEGLTANFGLNELNTEEHVQYSISYSKGTGLKLPKSEIATTTIANVPYTQEKVLNVKSKASNGAGVNTSLPYFYYDFNSSYLTDANKYTIDQIVSFMRTSPDAKVRVHVYLETRSNVKYNEWMSERRADRVIDYIISQGIPASRLEKWVERVSSNVAPREGASRGSAEFRRCDFEVM